MDGTKKTRTTAAEVAEPRQLLDSSRKLVAESLLVVR